MFELRTKDADSKGKHKSVERIKGTDGYLHASKKLYTEYLFGHRLFEWDEFEVTDKSTCSS